MSYLHVCPTSSYRAGKFEHAPLDSGVGFSLEDTSSSQHTQILYEEKEEGSVGGDSSLNEMTFFGHSLAPAQQVRPAVPSVKYQSA